MEDATSPRARYRAQVRTEIKEHAWRQIAGAGASALSLNAIAKNMGMTGPALYRYFGSRDDLLTELVTDAYRSLADTFRAASGEGLTGLGHALRGWALADPQRYFLVYGTPVPGYHAPDDVTAIAAEIMAVLLDACATGPAPAPAPDLDAHLAGHRAWDGGHGASEPVLRRALTAWTRLHGVLSLELAGHFTGMGFDPVLLFDAELSAL
ncbi:TetR/AcrR family transcriptional regulator [Streptomyces mangrovisoli]|uniref:TetR family transcriptional regulator n=1 Tax=Streptomyces mangrovisoli TaxID=1428628 RepID=A0A1J4P407_9ACTN|nr:TetR/AcrR family transcriptional regulator [Streptomyces mangrovisoli]OIJ68190.1 TetR family transcriptional regulator [Streptomyces mangrovisoli]